MELRHISVPHLIAEAGGDPWAVNRSLQAGRPAQIADLAQAFHDAGRCTTESGEAFAEARRRFEAAWNRENGEHPINDSAEVRRATHSLGVQAAQLPKIGTDLEDIAAALAEAQRDGGVLISVLETQLHDIDSQLGEALRLEQSGELTAAERAVIDGYITELENQAISDTKSALGQLESVRGGYSDYLQQSLASLRVEDGYDPTSIEGLDGDGLTPHGERDETAVRAYDAAQRAKDEALVNSPGGMTPEKADAAARLRDYAVATDPAADADARRLASERLDDFAMAHFTGPLPVDPLLGTDARSRAQMRLDWQRKLEKGFAGQPPMAPDQVTQLLDNSEQQARVLVTQQAAKVLEREGLSASAASQVISSMSQGIPLSEIARYDAGLVGAGGAGIQASAGAVSTGAHNLPGSIGVLSAEDAEVVKRLGKRLGIAGSLADMALAGVEITQGAPAGETAGKAVGGFLGGMGLGWAGGALGGMALGPGGAFVGGVLGATLGGFGLGEFGGAVGSQLDH
ncbi:hypothetical protein [Mycobacterium spongiae]|uniref:Predicted hydrolase N-terminal domain-containing protein n=1 Tax=Mycobacterium spongiae TaxID=886343 RepID=A0A975K2U5_9MYCO|nr:hypothetical protein [Mycobacterium spongiae]QUR69469.1 hypothetical protein F6B93_22450 [Mycobacterium spongiae]